MCQLWKKPGCLLRSPCPFQTRRSSSKLCRWFTHGLELTIEAAIWENVHQNSRLSCQWSVPNIFTLESFTTCTRHACITWYYVIRHTTYFDALNSYAYYLFWCAEQLCILLVLMRWTAMHTTYFNALNSYAAKRTVWPCCWWRHLLLCCVSDTFQIHIRCVYTYLQSWMVLPHCSVAWC